MPVTGEGPDAPMCSGTIAQSSSDFYPILRVLLRAKSNGLYVTGTTPQVPLTASCGETVLTYNEAFDLIPQPGGYPRQLVI